MQALLVAGVGAELFGDIASYNQQQGAIAAEESASNLEAKQQEVAFSQKTLANINQTKRLLGMEAVTAAGQGESLASGSLRAITFNTFQKGKETDQNLATEDKIAQAQNEAKQSALSQQSAALPWQLLGTVAKQGVEIGSLAP